MGTQSLNRSNERGLFQVLLLASALVGYGCGDESPKEGESPDGGRAMSEPDGSRSDDASRPDDAAPADAAVADATTDKNSGAECDSTWKAVQRSIFETKGCTTAACHGAEADADALQLSGEDVYENLINQTAKASVSPPMHLVMPGEQALSLLYLKVAAATNGTALPAGGGAPMPVGKTPLSESQLEALRLWIRAGAPKEGVVAGTQDLLDCAQPAEADPNKAPRPPIPEPSEGFQHAAGPWSVKANAEDEVCFATYYDLSSEAPEWARFPCEIGGREQTCVGYNRRELSQDAQSHHSIINVYGGEVGPTDPSWGEWRCAGGEAEGTSCDPTKLGVAAAQGGADCGESGVCQATPRKMVGCSGFGPTNKEPSNVGAGGSQSPVSADRFPDGVYARLPIKGVVLWNSHGFNLTTKETTVEQFNTFWYAPPEQRVYLVRGIFSPGPSIGASPINVLPYQQQEVCSVYTLPQYARLIELSAHAHKRSIRWRTWLPPHETPCSGPSCMPSDGTPDYLSRQYNDPVILAFNPALSFDEADEASRTLKFCSLYDNGMSDPSLLKRKSQLADGSSCGAQLYCVGGDKAGEPCSDDSACGPGGVCDACAVRWGVTTEDEMFFLMGNYYVVPPT